MRDQWVLLWSGRQNALHIEGVREMLVKNGTACRDGRACDYITLAIGTREDVDAEADRVRPLLIERDRVRGEVPA